jgi:3-deoxy-D-manno-octulosonic-acid transferase
VHFLYNLLTYLLLIPYAIYWLIKGIGNRTYLDRLPQRFGLGFPKLDGCIWVHAVSVGEVQASAPLIHTLREKFPERRLVVTTVTPTGAARVAALFGDDVEHCYIPFEFPHAINAFFSSVRPQAAMIMETEIWPNLYRGCGVRGIPLVLVSARISPRSIPGYRRLLPLIRDTLSHGIVIAAQTKADAERFLKIGANPSRTRVTGNIKFDVKTDPKIAEHGKQLRSTLFDGRPVWVAASTHEGEEQQVLNAHRALLEKHPDLLLVLIPRHPERFSGVRDLVERQGFSVTARTDNKPCERSTEVLLVDTMGEVPLFFAAGDVAFLGGSLVPVGGHNFLEPAAQGVPIVTGPHLFNAVEIAEKFIELGACRVVPDSDALALAVQELIENPATARTMGDNGKAVLEQNRGSLERLLVLVEPLLEAEVVKPR